MGKDATLNLTKTSGVTEDLTTYLTEIQNLPKSTIADATSLFKDIVPDAD